MKPGHFTKYRLEIVAGGSILLFIFWGFLIYKPPGQLSTKENLDIHPRVSLELQKGTKNDSQNVAAQAAPPKPQNGVVKTFDENGKIETIETFKNGVWDGKYEGFAYIPQASLHYKTEEGFYVKGKKSGIWKYYDFYYDSKTGKLGDKLITYRMETYKNGKRNGKSIEYDPKYGFKLIESNFIADKENGIRKNYCPHGKDRGKLYFFNEVINDQIVRSYNYQCDCDQSTPESY